MDTEPADTTAAHDTDGEHHDDAEIELVEEISIDGMCGVY